MMCTGPGDREPCRCRCRCRRLRRRRSSLHLGRCVVDCHGAAVVVGMGNSVVVLEWDSNIEAHTVGLDGVSASHALKNEPLKNELSLALEGLVCGGVDGERGEMIKKMECWGLPQNTNPVNHCEMTVNHGHLLEQIPGTVDNIPTDNLSLRMNRYFVHMPLFS